ncbi:hypothetical protein [Parvularcula marina]|uniref:Uncharacterized protein n=1 Tax=Parvularcula marina TaxID=2292771 RepID=A0A371RFD0_9PROT|nr:hypothetical protein [Parvularcula marina]RFB04157.1 hypothetical protein DX908_01990 [Parvularcula marina]
MATKPDAKILLKPLVIEIHHSADEFITIPFNQITRIEIFKRDILVTDLICSQIYYQTNGGIRSAIIHEEMTGFDEALSRIAKFPGFMTGWRDRVVLPPFEENRTTVFRRDG